MEPDFVRAGASFLNKVREEQKRLLAQLVSGNYDSLADYKADAARYNAFEQSLRLLDEAEKEADESVDPDDN